MTSKAEIDNLLSTNRYSATIIPQLEVFVVSQATGNSEYDFEANRTLVKLYQFFPQNAKMEYQLMVYLLAMMYGHDSDVGAIHCLIPEQVKCQDPFPLAITAVEHSDACLFANVFETLSTFKECNFESIQSLVQSSKAVNALRTQIIEVLSLTFKNISTEAILKHLNLKFEELKTFSSKAIESVDTDKVTFVDNVENTKRIVRSHQDGASSSCCSNAAGNYLDYGTIRSMIGGVVFEDGMMPQSVAE
mmetsp:Transcript_7709/g.14533  ORF Transcript_7709/g.14533 Transcript_7709/m.14533 type:complete len:247 (+) Transcript_7709:468-1208(+)|eukprot:CAMPEP_0176495364 /NCGR_PEP_ID=MMETSP0200_2-20121128/10608_1 /TAXON_ID=947934 /ORGANISM="Chaetoceros sp., Strain GSL56" /LENGTH=246 /DNA_ID=CAMNT_0017893219 /DNA_START=120 /DNA_END=860 /DNA_ORIENTATION=-